MENTETQEKLSLTFSFDNLDILGSFKHNIVEKDKPAEYINLVHIKGNVDFEQDAVLILPEFLLQEALEVWIKDKTSICEIYNHYCGEMGSIGAIEYEEIEPTFLNEYDEKTKEYVPVSTRTFIVHSIRDFADMEHG